MTVPSVDTDTLDMPIDVTDDTGGVSYVNGWMDWDNDGVFQADESIFASGTFASATGGLTVSGGAGEVPGPGTYDVTVNVPDLTGSHTIGGTLYSRFRVATQLSGVSSAVGASLDGEVEDYSTTLNTLPVDLAYLASQRSRRHGGRAVAYRPGGRQPRLQPLRPRAERHTDAADRRARPLEGADLDRVAGVRADRPHPAPQLWLEDVSLDGVPRCTARTRWALLRRPQPARADRLGCRTPTPLPPAPADDAAAVAAAAREASQRRQAAPATPEYGPVATFSVTEDGIQQITYDDLLAAGVDLNGVPAALLALTSPDGPVAIEVTGAEAFGPGSAVRFLGEPLDTIYTGTNVYRLHIDPSVGAGAVDPQRPGRQRPPRRPTTAGSVPRRVRPPAPGPPHSRARHHAPPNRAVDAVPTTTTSSTTITTPR